MVVLQYIVEIKDCTIVYSICALSQLIKKNKLIKMHRVSNFKIRSLYL